MRFIEVRSPKTEVKLRFRVSGEPFRTKWGSIGKISFGGNPNSRDVLFLQIFLKRAAKPKQSAPPAEPIEPDPAPHQRFPKPPFPQPSPEPVEPDLALHIFAPKPPKPSPEPSPEPCWTWPGSAPNLLRKLLLNLTWLCTKASQTFTGTFSGTLLNLTWLCIRNPVEPDLALHQSLPCPSPEPSEPSPEHRWTWPGACTSPHRSYSGLKTPLAYAVGKNWS